MSSHSLATDVDAGAAMGAVTERSGADEAVVYARMMRSEASKSGDRAYAQWCERTAEVIEGVLADLDEVLAIAETNAASARKLLG